MKLTCYSTRSCVSHYSDLTLETCQLMPSKFMPRDDEPVSPHDLVNICLQRQQTCLEGVT
jgi:hypothetical protein